MYSIYADQICIYSDVSPSNKNKIMSPTLTLQDNAAGSLEFTIPEVNVGYDDIKRLVSEIVVKRDGTEIWSGRILSENHDFYKNKKIYCEGELAYFNDSIQPPAEYHDISPRSLLERIVAIHNSQVTSKYQFTVGAVTVVDPNDSLYRYTNYESTLEVLMDKFVDRLGGHLRVRKLNGVRYLDYLADYPKTATQQINFGKNLLDFAKNYSMDDFYTVLVPRGEQISASEYSDSRDFAVGDYCIYNGYIYRCIVAIPEEGEDWTASHWKKIQKYYEALTPYLTIEEVNNGSIFLGNTELISKYGKIVGVRDWDDVTDPQVLLNKARSELATINYDNIIIDVTAVDLRLLNVKYEAFDILDNVRIISRPHGLDRLFPIREMKIPMDKPENTSFVLTHNTAIDGSLTGGTVKSIQSVANTVDSLSDSVSSMPSSILKSAVANATSLINMATNGYVTIIKNKNGTSELLITDEKDYMKAKKVWRWNINGLGYSSTGYNGTYGTAITMNGAIVANYITAGTMSADRIRGGSFEVGGSGYAKDGEIIVKDSSDNTVALLNKFGLNVYNGYITGSTLNGNTINTVSGSIGKWLMGDGYLMSFNGETEAASTRKVELHTFTGDENSPAFCVYTRDSVDQGWTTKIAITYAGNISSQSAVDVYPSDDNYGMHVHGAFSADAKIQTTNGAIIMTSEGHLTGKQGSELYFYNAEIGHNLECGSLDCHNPPWNSSDIRFKKDIEDVSVEDADYILKQLEPKYFRFIEDDKNKRIGFIAQDVKEIVKHIDDSILVREQTRKVFPGELDIKEYLALNYIDLIPLLVKGYQKQQDEIALLKQEIELLKNRETEG